MFSFQSRGFEQTIQTTPTSALVILTEIIIFCKFYLQEQKNTKLYLALVVILQCLDGFSMKQNVMGYLQVYSTIRNTKHILNYYNFPGPLLKMTRLLITGFCSPSELQNIFFQL